MKGQLDKESLVNPITESEPNVEDWSPEKLRKRSRELQLVDVHGVCQAVKLESGVRRCDSRVDEIILSEIDEESKSPSRSTTSDSQITVRSSPMANAIDKISVCLKCHKNCKNNNLSPPSISNSLKVQHSQSSSNRCCRTASSGENSSSSSQKSLITSSPTLTNDDTNSKLSKTEAELRFGDRDIFMMNGNCTEHEKQKAKSKSSIENRIKCQTPCKCKCNPEQFDQTTLSPDELKHETCKIIDNIHQVHNLNRSNYNKITPITTITDNNTHDLCKCLCDNVEQDNEDDEWSMMLIGLAQINPTSSLIHIDPFEAVPTISVVPPTPEGLTARFSNLFNSRSKSNSREDEISPENSPEDSPLDEEPPYLALNTSLRRYGTMSSLEKLPSEDEEKTYNSSDEEDLDNDDIQIVTKEIYSNTQSLRNWTARAGSYVAEKMSFLEESKAFFDKYLGRKDPSSEQDEDVLDECTSGATSGEEVWGTPTSGGENEEMMFNSDQTHSSPTKSSSSMTGDDDTELMMDELLMAPPMSANSLSNVRGLLPRRRLEPLFEEDTESADSDDDNSPINGSSLNQGQVLGEDQVNGHISRNSSETNESSGTTTPVERKMMEMTKRTTTPERETVNYGSVADISCAAVQAQKNVRDYVANTDSVVAQSNVVCAGLSPRLEMRLALNRDIMGDEDLLNYEPGPDLTTILGHDLSTYHRMTARDILNRSVNRAITKEALNTFSQQRNAKLDTPTPNRKKSSPSTWSSSVSVDRVDESVLTDLERLAKREKMFCMSQLRSGRVVPQPDRTRKIGRDETALALQFRKRNKFFDFITRRNSDNHLLKFFSKEIGEEDVPTFFGDNKDISPRKDIDKTLDRRFWKQLSKRRRSSSISDISAS